MQLFRRFIILIVSVLSFLLSLHAAESWNVDLLSQYTVWCSIHHTEVKDDILYIAAGASGLRSIDISDPSAPFERGFYPTPDACELIIRDDYAFVSASGAGLRIIDISNPDNLHEVGYFPAVQQGCGTCCLAGDIAFTKQLNVGIAASNLSNIHRPGIRVAYLLNESIHCLAATDSLLLAGTSESGLLIFDASDPCELELIATHKIKGYPFDVEIKDHFAYIAAASGGLRVIDISDPEKPQEVSHLSNSAMRCSSIEIQGITAYLSGGKRCYIVDISNPRAPRIINEIESYCNSFAVVPEAYLITSDGSSIDIFLISDVSRPVHLSNFSRIGYMADVRISNGLAYVGSGQYGLVIYDISDITAPVELGRLETDNKIFCTKLIVKEPYAYLSSHQTDLAIVDISDPASPLLVGYMDRRGRAGDFDVEGSYAYFAASDDGLRIIDVSNPSEPVEVGCYSAPNAIYYVEVVGDFAFITGDPMTILDVSDPESPRVVRQYGKGVYDRINQITAHGNYLYLQCQPTSSQQNAFAILDITQPSKPEEIFRYPLERFGDMVVSDGYAYLGSLADGFLIFDVTYPKRTMLVGSGAPPGLLSGIDAIGNTVAVASGGYLSFYDCSAAQQVADAGRIMVERTTTLSTGLCDAYEINRVIYYHVWIPGSIEIDLCSTAGHPIKSIVAGWRGPGDHTISIDTYPLKPGLYIIRLTAQEETVLKKMLVLQ